MLVQVQWRGGVYKRSGIFGRAVFNLYSLALLLSRYRCRYREIGDRSRKKRRPAEKKYYNEMGDDTRVAAWALDWDGCVRVPRLLLRKASATQLGHPLPASFPPLRPLTSRPRLPRVAHPTASHPRRFASRGS